MSDKKIKFEIVTPERIVLKESIVQVSVPTSNGEITVLPDHIPLVATLAPGVIEIVKHSGEHDIMSVSGGFLEVLKGKVVVLADTAERAEDIDVDRAEEARVMAEKTKSEAKHFDTKRFADISAKIAKEMARSRAAQRWRRFKQSGK